MHDDQFSLRGSGVIEQVAGNPPDPPRRRRGVVWLRETSSSALGSRMCNDRVKRRKKTFSAYEFHGCDSRGFVV